MAVLATVELDKLLEYRFDAECYRPELQAVERRIAALRPRPLETIASVSDGNHISIADHFCQTGVRYLKGGEVSDVFINDNEPTYIPAKVYAEITRAHVEAGDVLLAAIGSVGPVALVTDKYERLSCSCKLVILRPHGISGALLTAYLLSPSGQALLLRRNRGSVQQGIVLPDIRNFPVPEFSERVREKVEQVMAKAAAEKRRAELLYREAESELLNELDWLNLERQPVELFHARDFNDLSKAGRADAEFFQPRVQKILAKLYEQKRRISDVAQLREEPFNPARGVPFHYIEISDVSSTTLVTGVQLFGEDAPSRAKYHVCADDVITSTVRPNRRLSGLVDSNQTGWVCSSGFAVIRPVSVPPEYLVAYLRLPPVCHVMDAYTTATMYPAISVGDILNLPLFIPNSQILDRVCEAVHRIRCSSQETEKMLSEAKLLVEEELLPVAGSAGALW